MLALAPIVLLAVASVPDQLEDLVQRAAQLPFFSASFEVTSPTGEIVQQIEVLYGGPDRASVRTSRAAGGTHTVVVGSMLLTQSEIGGTPWHARVDVSRAFAPVRLVDERLCDAFPGTVPWTDPHVSLGFRWAFDKDAGRTDLGAELAVNCEDHGSMAWLTKLIESGVTPSEEGDLLRFALDARFEVTVSRLTGMLQEVRATVPAGVLRLSLTSADFTTAPSAERFAIPSERPGSLDRTSEVQQQLATALLLPLRKRIALKLAATIGALERPEDSRESSELKARRVLRHFHEQWVPLAFENTRRRMAELESACVERLKAYKTQGHSLETLESVVREARESLGERLSNGFNSYAASLASTEAIESISKSPELAKLDAEIFERCFNELIREPILASFGRACEEALR